MAIDFNTYSNHNLPHGKTWNFLRHDFILYIMRKNQHGPISTIYMMTFGQMKIWHVTIGIILWKYFFIEMLISTTIMIIWFKCIYIVTHGTIKSFHMAYDGILGEKNLKEIITYIDG